MDISAQSSFVQAALAYSIPGMVFAVMATLARWYFPIVASSASASDHEPAARRVHRFQSIARGFSYLEYALVIVGTFVEIIVLWSNSANQSLHAIYLGVYALLWLMLTLNWQKRPVIGRVVTPRQQPVHRAVVKASHDNVHFHEAAVTDENGRFHMRVYPGKYQLRAEKTDHEPAVTTITTDSNMASRVSLVAKPNRPQERMTSPVKADEEN